MVDIFAFIIPVFALALWAAAETRKKHVDVVQLDELPTSQVQINLKYTPAPTEENPTSTPTLPTTPSPDEHTPFLSFPFSSSSSSSSAFSRWLAGQDMLVKFLVPLNVLTVAFFAGLYVLRCLAEHWIPIASHFLIFSLYALLVCAGVMSLRICKRNAESSLVVSILACLRALEYLAPLLIHHSYELLIAQAVLDTWGNFLAIYLLSILPREFSSEYKCMESYIEEAFSTQPEKKEEQSGFSITKENVCMGLLLLASLATSMLVVVPDWHEKLWVMISFECSIACSLLLGLILTTLAIVKTIPAAKEGCYLSGISTRWLIVAVIIGSVLVRLVYDAGATTFSVLNEAYVPFVSSRAFISCWKETFTQIIGLSFFMLYTINKENKYKADKSQMAFTTSKRIFCAYLLCLHLVVVGLLLETTTLSFTLSCTCVLSLLFTSNASLVLFKYVPPLTHFCGPTAKQV